MRNDMAYRLKNWVLLRDMMCSNQKETQFLIVKAYKEMTLGLETISPPPSIKEDMILKMINNLKCVISQDGLEAGLVMWREDLSTLFKCPGECMLFEEFLEKLDVMLQSLKETMSEKHEL
jgi:hypothetical protein